jgi:hypothetical protein
MKAYYYTHMVRVCVYVAWHMALASPPLPCHLGLFLVRWTHLAKAPSRGASADRCPNNINKYEGGRMVDLPPCRCPPLLRTVITASQTSQSVSAYVFHSSAPNPYLHFLYTRPSKYCRRQTTRQKKTAQYNKCISLPSLKGHSINHMASAAHQACIMDGSWQVQFCVSG